MDDLSDKSKNSSMSVQDLELIETMLAEEDASFLKELEQMKSDFSADVLRLSGQDTDIDLGFDELSEKKFKSINNTKSKILNTIKFFIEMVLQPFLIKKQPKKVLLFWLTFAGIFTVFFLFKKSNFFNQNDSLFLKSYADLGVQVHDYDMLKETESFFDNIRFSKNILALSRMTANIKATDDSSENPMMVFEVVVQGISNDTIVEIKDREAEFRDIILRETEDFNYDQLSSPDGKLKLLDQILKRINANLTQGQIRKVFFGQVIIKN